MWIQKTKLSKVFIHLCMCICMVLLIASPAFAIDNPDNINFGSGSTPKYKVFENVVETGDMLFVAEALVEYTPDEPTDYTASEAFLFEVLNITGTAVLLSIPLNAYGDRPISIYQTAAQAATLVSGTAYGLRITGNPLVFPSQTGNTVTTYLAADDYIDQTTATDSSNPLRDFLIIVANNIEDYDTPGTSYLVLVAGITYLTTGGGNIFIEGIPNLSTFCPILFQTASEPLTSDAPESIGAYSSSLTVENKFGTSMASGVATLGSFVGINQTLMASVILLGLSAALAMYIYKRTESGVAVLVLISMVPFIGAYFGLIPLALAFIFLLFVIIPLGYFFFSRGAL